MANGILMLNDYCLLELFKYLSLHDLANFKETYRSLGAAVDMAFYRKTRGTLLFAREENMHEAFQIVRQFRTSVTYLTFYYKDMRGIRLSKLFSVVYKHCNEKVNKLEVCGSTTSFSKEGNVLSIQLNSMYGRYTNIDPFLRIVDDFNSLNVLRLSDPYLDDTKIAILAQLKRLKVLKLEYGCRMKINSYFDSLLALCGNKNLEHIIFLCNLRPSYQDSKDIDRINEVNYLRLIKKRKASAAENCLHLTFNCSMYVTSLGAIPFDLIEANDTTLRFIDRHDSTYEYHNLCKL